MSSTIFPVYIRFSDVDAMGIVHNAIYLNYFEQARIDFFKQFIGKDWNWAKQGVIVARNEVDYISPILFNDEIFIEIFCPTIGNSSFTVGYKLFSKENDVVKLRAKGQTIMVCYDHQLRQKVAVYDSWKEILTKNQGQF